MNRRKRSSWSKACGPERNIMEFKITDNGLESYRRWFENPENSHRCESCPNRGDDPQYLTRADRVEGPCGQQHCWVDVTCGL